MKKGLILSVFLLFLVMLPVQVNAAGTCDPGTCSCPAGQVCKWEGAGTYNCRPAQAEGATCNTLNPCNDCGDGLACQSNGWSGNCVKQTSIVSGGGKGIIASRGVCDGLPAACGACFDQGKVWTAIGCLPTDPGGFLKYLLTIGGSLAGAIAFLLILLGGIQILTSAGNPEKLNAGKELVGAAVAGLMLIIFSIFLLQFIGYNMLRIPGFG